MDEDVGRADALDQRLALRPVGEIAGDRLLAAIERDEARAVAFDERRAPFARIVALGPLDLDHLGAEEGQDLPGIGAGQVLAELDDLDACRAGLARSSQVAAQDLARDHHALHLARALADAADAHLAVPALERQVLGHAHAAMDLHRAVDHAAAAFRGGQLGDRGLDAEGQAARAPSRRPPG